MFVDLFISDLDYTKTKGDYVVLVTQTKGFTHPAADYTLFYEFVTLGTPPKDIQDMGYERFSWVTHGSPLVRACRDASALKRNTRLVFISQDYESDATAIALAATQSAVLKKLNLTPLVLPYITPTIDLGAMVDFHDLTSSVLAKLKVIYPKETKTYTRYEMLELTTADLVLPLMLKNKVYWEQIKDKLLPLNTKKPEGALTDYERRVKMVAKSKDVPLEEKKETSNTLF